MKIIAVQNFIIAVHNMLIFNITEIYKSILFFILYCEIKLKMGIKHDCNLKRQHQYIYPGLFLTQQSRNQNGTRIKRIKRIYTD